MHPALTYIYQLQQEDSALTALKRQLDSLDPATAEKRALTALEQQYQALEVKQLALHADLQDAELKLKSLETKIQQLDKKLYSGSVVNSKELSALEQDIEMLKRQRGQLDEQILLGWDEMESLKQQTETNRAHQERASAAYQSQYQRYLQTKSDIEQQAAQHLKKRKALLPHIEEVILQKYETLRGKLGGVAVARVENDICAMCHTAITAYIKNRLKSDSVFITCESCGRLLYLPSE